MFFSGIFPLVFYLCKLCSAFFRFYGSSQISASAYLPYGPTKERNTGNCSIDVWMHLIGEKKNLYMNFRTHDYESMWSDNFKWVVFPAEIAANILLGVGEGGERKQVARKSPKSAWTECEFSCLLCDLGKLLYFAILILLGDCYYQLVA